MPPDITDRWRPGAELVAAIEARITSRFGRMVVEKWAAFRGAHEVRRGDATTGPAKATARAPEALSAIRRGFDDVSIGAPASVSRRALRDHVASLRRGLGANRPSTPRVCA